MPHGATRNRIDDAMDVFVLLFGRSFATQVIVDGNRLKSGDGTHAARFTRFVFRRQLNL